MLTALGKPGSGYSAENLVVTARWEDGPAEKLVLRRDTAEPPIYPAQSPDTTTGVVLQHSVMEALRRAGTCRWPTAWGSSRIRGCWRPILRHAPRSRRCARGEPALHPEGFFVDASPDERSRLVSEGLGRWPASTRRPPTIRGWRRCAPPGSCTGAERQLEVWELSLRCGLRGRSSLLFEDCPALAARPVAAAVTAGALMGRLSPGQHDLAGLRRGVYHRL